MVENNKKPTTNIVGSYPNSPVAKSKTNILANVTKDDNQNNNNNITNIFGQYGKENQDGEVDDAFEDGDEKILFQDIASVAKTGVTRVYDSGSNLAITQFVYFLDKTTDLITYFSLGYRSLNSIDKEEIIEVEDVEIEEEIEEVDVPFAVIEDVPIFPGCERVKKSERRDCFQEQMNKHIRKNFRYPEIAQEMGIQGRVYVNFIISKDGSITNIRMRGPDKNLEKEAQRIISKLPNMTPGKQRGRAVRVPFSIPITFRLQ